MIAVDTNILIYSHSIDSEWHGIASRTLEALAEGDSPWAIPWPCIHEFMAVATNPRMTSQTDSVTLAMTQVEAWMESPGLRLLGEGPGYWERLRALLDAGNVAGGMVHDARIAALCLSHGVTELWTADRDFDRFPGLPTRNPLAGAGPPAPA